MSKPKGHPSAKPAPGRSDPLLRDGEAEREDPATIIDTELRGQLLEELYGVGRPLEEEPVAPDCDSADSNDLTGADDLPERTILSPVMAFGPTNGDGRIATVVRHESPTGRNADEPWDEREKSKLGSRSLGRPDRTVEEPVPYALRDDANDTPDVAASLDGALPTTDDSAFPGKNREPPSRDREPLSRDREPPKRRTDHILRPVARVVETKPLASVQADTPFDRERSPGTGGEPSSAPIAPRHSRSSLEPPDEEAASKEPDGLAKTPSEPPSDELLDDDSRALVDGKPESSRPPVRPAKRHDKEAAHPREGVGLDEIHRWSVATHVASKLIPILIAAFVIVSTVVVSIMFFGTGPSRDQHVRLQFMDVQGRPSTLPPLAGDVPTRVFIETEPPGVLVVFQQAIVGRTPCMAELPVKLDDRVGVELSGPYFEGWVGELGRDMAGDFRLTAKLVKK